MDAVRPLFLRSCHHHRPEYCIIDSTPEPTQPFPWSSSSSYPPKVCNYLQRILDFVFKHCLCCCNILVQYHLFTNKKRKGLELFIYILVYLYLYLYLCICVSSPPSNFTILTKFHNYDKISL